MANQESVQVKPFLTCGCRVEPGSPVSYGHLRAHIEKHVQEGLEEAVARILMLELITKINRSTETETKLFEVRNRVMDALELWPEARKFLDALVPENKIREALF